MSDDLTARLREMAEETHSRIEQGWQKHGSKGVIHAALLAAVRLGKREGMEEAAEIVRPFSEGLASAIRAAMPGDGT